MDKTISTPWVVTAIVVALIVIGAFIWRGMHPAIPPAVDPTGGAASITRGHAGFAPPGAVPPGPR